MIIKKIIFSYDVFKHGPYPKMTLNTIFYNENRGKKSYLRLVESFHGAVNFRYPQEEGGGEEEGGGGSGEMMIAI